MKILLWCDDLMSRTRLRSPWEAAGAVMLKRSEEGKSPDLIVLDLGANGAMDHLRRLRGKFSDVPILVFGPHVDGEGLLAAKAAGASEIVSRGAVVERVLHKLQR